jgi:AcrR family transcriptional regulator
MMLLVSTFGSIITYSLGRMVDNMPNKHRDTYHHGSLRETLITAALTLLAAQGAAGLSLREVASAAGVSHAAPYRHFRDKTALLEAIAAAGYARLMHACQQAEKRFPRDPRRQLVEAGMAYLMLAAENPEIIHLMFGGLLEKCGDELRQAAQSAFQSLMKIVENGQRSGLYRKAATMDLTLAAWSMVHGLSMLISSGPLKEAASSKRRIRKLGDVVSRTLLTGMLKR